MALKLVAIAGGIFVSYGIAGLVQEKIFKTTYGPEKAKFEFVSTLLFMTTVVNFFYSLAMLRARKTPTDSRVSVWYQMGIAGAFLLASGSSQLALKWVSYPAQVLAKSAKPIPVLIMGALVGRKSYHWARYVVVGVIVVGVAAFVFRDDKAVRSPIGFGVGELLLLFSLLMDGVLNSLQERVMSNYTVTSDQLMFDINKWSAFFFGIFLYGSGQIFEFGCFVHKYPYVLWRMLAFAACGAFGQFFIFKCITEFGTLTCSIVTTSRKFFSVLASIVFYGHVLLVRQWAAIFVVFGGLGVDIYLLGRKSE